MVAEQWCRRRSGGDGETARESERERKREDGGKLPLHPDSPCLKTQLGPTGARSAWRGAGRKEGREGESTRQGRSKDRPQALCVFFVSEGDGGAEVVVCCGCGPQRQHITATTSGPRKERTHCLIQPRVTMPSDDCCSAIGSQSVASNPDGSCCAYRHTHKHTLL